MNHLRIKTKEIESLKRELNVVKTQLNEEQQSKSRQAKFFQSTLNDFQVELDLREKSVALMQAEVKKYQSSITNLKHHIKRLNEMIIEQKRNLTSTLTTAKKTVAEYQNSEEEVEFMQQLMVKQKQISNEMLRKSRLNALEQAKKMINLKENDKKFVNPAMPHKSKERIVCQSTLCSNGNTRNTPTEACSDATTQTQIEPESTDLDASNVTMHEKEIMELKAKFLRHKEILKSNCDQAESEVIRLDEIYHDTVDMVLKAFNAIPEIVESNEELSKIKTSLESSLLEAQQESASAPKNHKEMTATS